MKLITATPNKSLFNSFQLLATLLLAIFLSSCGYDDNLHIQHRQLIMLWYDEFEPLDESLNKQYGLLKEGELTPFDFSLQMISLEYANKGADVHFQRYIKAKPNSKWPHLLYGTYLIRQAINARGARNYADTSQASIDEMMALLKQATPYLEAARENQASIGLYASAWLTMNMLLGAEAVSSDEENLNLMQEAMARDGEITRPVYAYFQMLYPQWGGSEHAMQAFIDDIRLRHPKLADGLQSDFYWSRGTRFDANGQEAAATAAYEKAVSISARSVVLKALGDQYMQAGKCDAAAEVFARNLDENDEWDLYTLESLMQAHYCAGNDWRGNRARIKRSELFTRYRAGK